MINGFTFFITSSTLAFLLALSIFGLMNWLLRLYFMLLLEEIITTNIIITVVACEFFTPVNAGFCVTISAFMSPKLRWVFWLILMDGCDSSPYSQFLQVFNQAFWDLSKCTKENWWHCQIFQLSGKLRVFGLLSSSLLLFPQRFGWYILQPSSGVCLIQEPIWNFELRLLLFRFRYKY